MASRANKIDIEWSNSLVGLPLKIPDNWWLGYTGSYLHAGKLVAFDVVNRIPVMAPILAQILGVHFLGEHMSLKMGPFAPFSSHDSSSFKNMWLLI
jgi:hypothetical protein